MDDWNKADVVHKGPHDHVGYNFLSRAVAFVQLAT